MNFASLLCIISLMLYVNIRCNSNGSRLTKELIEIFYKDGKQVVTIQEKITDFVKSNSNTPVQGQVVQGQMPTQEGVSTTKGVQGLQNQMSPKTKAYNVFSDKKPSSKSRVNAINNTINATQRNADMTDTQSINGMNIPQMTNASLNEIADKSNNFVINNVKKNVKPKYKRN